MDIDDRKILVTGAAGGLGVGIVRGMASAGARVYMLDINDEGGKSLADDVNGAGGRVEYIHCDLNDLRGTEQILLDLVERVDGIDVLVNNAAIYPSKAFEKYSMEEYEHVQRINVEAAVVCSRAVIPGMRTAGRGSIINVASITFYGGWADLFPYVVSKGGLIGMTRALARELGPCGITVNAICPGAFPTAAEEIHPDPEAYQKFVLDHQAVKRRGTPEDVANIIMFLASDASSFITGQTVNVDGGWVMK